MLYDTEEAAERAKARMVIERMRAFLSGTLAFDEAFHFREYAAPVKVMPIEEVEKPDV